MRRSTMIFIMLVSLSCVNGRGVPTRVFKDVVTTQGVVRGYLTPDPAHFAFLGVQYGRPTRHDRFKLICSQSVLQSRRYRMQSPEADTAQWEGTVITFLQPEPELDSAYYKHSLLAYYEAPKPPKEWDGTYEATYRVKCPQPGGEGDENCLVVNIFAPQDAEGLPVLVLVHDGAFQYGWGNFQPPVRLLREFVIVTFNYRVGALGFLCLGTPEVPGNAGLKDQIAALYWIQRNIANFGGSPYDVTVYGIGAGAAAIELILLSNLSQGLLHKVILESGSALSPLSTVYDPVSLALDAAAVLEYEGSEDTNDLAMFFEDVSAARITKADKMFLPCIDKDNSEGMFDMDLVDILKSGNYHRVPMIVIYTDKLVVTEEELEEFRYMPESFEHLLPNNLDLPEDDVREKVADFVRNIYFEDVEENDLVNSHIEYFRDITIEYPVIRSAVYHASGGSWPVFLMKFTYNSNVESQGPHSLLNYFYTDNLSDNDELVAQRLVTLWSNFIKIGDPTPLTMTLIPVVWPPIQRQLHQADIAKVTGLEFGDKMVIRDTLSSQQVVFWDSIYKRYIKKHE